ncbi:hypothetical protein Curi_c12740 [Gottschalkia acidurici 9a]|uniref:Pilus assembly protein, PilO n=1 Tax=Gottschalkia acidurici (strain ATCC 7906 / DSM 604 / BCRC 14475 / CIP 104303 / KCTC 5404 / NCIMB 10678 / 9a) TaxID=1128398 RepID=K0AZY5_GOTA9|nr:hypothetical protein [Gottschalkia acidurici]AFS78285.1 hypothetical protein Curi_c12740 [Gottschalkia acidurici 9a]
MKKTLTKFEKIGLLTIVIAATMYFYVNKIYDPASEAYKSAKENLVTIKQEVEGIGVVPNINDIQKEVGELSEEYETIKLSLELLKQEKVQGKYEITNVIVEINKLMMKNNVTLNNMKWIEEDKEKLNEQTQGQTQEKPKESVQEGSDIEWTACELEFTGKLLPIIAFFNDIYGFESLVQVDEVNIEYDEEKDTYRAIMKVSI